MKGILRGLSTGQTTSNVQPTTTGTTGPTLTREGEFYNPQQGYPGTTGYTSGTGGNAPYTTYEEMPKQIRELPAIVRETVMPQQMTQVQPVIHRDREQTEVHKVVQPLRERDIAPTQIQYATLPQEQREAVRMPDTEFQRQYNAAPIQPQQIYAPTQCTMVEKPPIIEETVHRKIIEEVQPVLYKEVVQPVVIEQTKPIYETVVETPRLLSEQLPLRDLGVRTLGTEGFQQPWQQQQGWPQMQQPMMQQPLSRGLQESSQFPQQIGLQGLPPRNMRPSTELFGDNTGFGVGRSAYNQGLGTSGLGGSQLPTTPTTFPGQNWQSGQTWPTTGQYQNWPQGQYQNWPQGQTLPTSGQTTFPGQNLATSTGLSPNTTGTGLEGLPANPMQQRGGLGTALKEEIIKVEYEVFNVSPQQTSAQQPFVERTVTKLVEQPFAQTGLGTTQTGWDTTQTGLGTSTGLGTTQTGLGTSTGLGAQPTYGTGTTGTYLGEKYMEAKNLESNVTGTSANVGKASSVNPPQMV